jgi:hypothetical protein
VSIEEFINARGITRVLHFTTTTGLLGILAGWAVKSRAKLPKDHYLEYVYQPNCEIRYDPDWLDYVNLSIQEINSVFFDICAKKWHTDKEWCVLSFAPEILVHDGVVFATTNNSYPNVKRGAGISGLIALYAKTIGQCNKWDDSYSRPARRAPNLPTCPQAEVLYPQELSLDFLQRVHLSNDEQTDVLAGQIAALGRPKIEYDVDISVLADSIRKLEP